MVDYVRSATGFDQVFSVAYSMATTAHLVMLSERPEYNDKIKAGFLVKLSLTCGKL